MRRRVEGAASNLHLHVPNRNLRTRRPRRYVITRCDQGCDDEGNCCEEAEDVLGAGEGGVHCFGGGGFASSLGATYLVVFPV